jgi:ubiquinone/menaquinone biosynthesis C-methylase UbiE
VATNQEGRLHSVRPKKAYKGLAMEGFIARWYANSTKSRGDHKESALLAAAQLAAGASVLEVAPGPGYLAIELAKLGDFRVVGLDISQSFVEIARQNAKDAGVAVTFHQGNASSMPFEADSFDFIVCKAAFKNFAEPVEALNEMHRVLKPSGKALIVDLRPDASSEAIHAEVKKMGLGWFNSLLTKFIFKHSLIKRAYSQEQFRQVASQSAFKMCAVKEESIGLEVSFAKLSRTANEP